MTSSSQMKSANTISDKNYHSGKENRGKIKHENEKINPELSKYNVEINKYNLRDLQHEHYDEKIEKHNKHNNSEARRWGSKEGTLEEQKESALDSFLETFEGKQMKSQGKLTKNARWSTVSQIIYFGSDNTLNPFLDELEDSGASRDEIREVYSKAYENYVDKHNEEFPTLPIYSSDIHFDETTYHGHDHILAMGHTKTGNPSDSIDNALGEKYGYGSNFQEKVENFKKYREENDEYIYLAMSEAFEDLAEKYDLEVEFEPIRTGAKGGMSMEEYQRTEDLKSSEEELERQNEAMLLKLKEEEEKLKVKAEELFNKEKELNDSFKERDVLKKEVESLRFTKDFKGEILDITPHIATKVELDNKLRQITNDDFRILSLKGKDELVYADCRGDKPQRANLESIVEHVYEMKGQDIVIDGKYESTQELSYVASHMRWQGLPLGDNNAINQGFDLVTEAVGSKQRELESEKSL